MKQKLPILYLNNLIIGFHLLTSPHQRASSDLWCVILSDRQVPITHLLTPPSEVEKRNLRTDEA